MVQWLIQNREQEAKPTSYLAAPFLFARLLRFTTLLECASRMKTFASLLIVTIVAFGCHAPGRYGKTTLVAGSPPDVAAGLRLLAVDPDGTAHIEWPVTGQVRALRPNTATNMISIWTLDSTDPVAQRARLSVQHRRSTKFRCWPYDSIQTVKGERREFTPQELAQIARDHARREHVTTVDFGDPYPNIYVFTQKNP